MLSKILPLAKSLILFETVKNRPEEISRALDFCASELSEFSISRYMHHDSPSLLVTNTQSNNRNQHLKVVLNGHLDVVAANPKQFQPYEKDGRLYGRGSADMKASSAVMMAVFKEVAGQVGYPLGLQLVTDEEIGGFNGTNYQINEGLQCDFAIIGEPTNLDIATRAKGMLYLTLKTEGSTSHGAYPWKGENAILKMLPIIEAVSERFPIPSEESWQTTCNIGTINTSNSHNQVPGVCTCTLDIRTVPEDSREEILGIIKDLAGSAEIIVNYNEPAHETAAKNGFLKLLEESIIKNTGRQVKKLNRHGASDARLYSAARIPAIEFGPSGYNFHSEDEYVEIESLERQAKILKDFLMGLRQGR